MRVVIGLGSSDPCARDLLGRALALVAAHPRIALVAASDVVETPAYGGVTRARFLNAAVVVDTALAPASLLHELHAIESVCGRVRAVKNAARTLDLDVLLVLEQVGASTYSTSTSSASMSSASMSSASMSSASMSSASMSSAIATPHPRLRERAFAVIPAVDALTKARLPVPIALIDAVRRHARDPLVVRDALASPGVA